LVLASKETGLEVNANKTKYMVMSRDQNARQSHNVNTENSSFERMEGFKYMRNLTIKILFRKKLKVDRNQGMLAIIRCRIFYLPVCYPKILRLRYTEHN